jgi:hypothetical protein
MNRGRHRAGPVRLIVGEDELWRRRSARQGCRRTGLGLFQLERVEALGEPPVDRSEKIASLIAAYPDCARPQMCAQASPFGTKSSIGTQIVAICRGTDLSFQD